MKLIVMGFFEPVLDRLPADMRERMTGIIEGKI
jgi:Fe-S cluster assembly scaffold protein SufB